MIYKLYFKEKFAEDGLYPEPREYLLEAVSEHLKAVNYERWIELYWKKQLEGDSTPEEKKELEALKIDRELNAIIKESWGFKV